MSNENLNTRWAVEAASNATSLAEEAAILLEYDKIERAYYLAHMANEEAIKSLFIFCLPLLGNPLCEHIEINKLMRNHRTKNKYFLLIFNNILANLDPKEHPELAELAKDIKRNFDDIVNCMNDDKNNSMYVSVINGKLTTPKQTIEGVNVKSFINSAIGLAALVGQLPAHNQTEA